MNEGEYHNNVETKLTFCSRINKLDPAPWSKHTHTICAMPTSAEHP